MTNSSPRINSSTNTHRLIRTMKAVTRGIRVGRLDASFSGIRPPKAICSLRRARQRVKKVLPEAYESNPFRQDYAALVLGISLGVATTLRTASDRETRAIPLKIMLTPTRVPIAQAELDGHCM